MRLEILAENDLIIDLRSPSLRCDDWYRHRNLHRRLEHAHINMQPLSVTRAIPGVVLHVNVKLVFDAHQFAYEGAGERMNHWILCPGHIRGDGVSSRDLHLELSVDSLACRNTIKAGSLAHLSVHMSPPIISFPVRKSLKLHEKV